LRCAVHVAPIDRYFAIMTLILTAATPSMSRNAATAFNHDRRRGRTRYGRPNARAPTGQRLECPEETTH